MTPRRAARRGGTPFARANLGTPSISKKRDECLEREDVRPTPACGGVSAARVDERGDANRRSRRGKILRQVILTGHHTGPRRLFSATKKRKLSKTEPSDEDRAQSIIPIRLGRANFRASCARKSWKGRSAFTNATRLPPTRKHSAPARALHAAPDVRALRHVALFGARDAPSSFPRPVEHEKSLHPIRNATRRDALSPMLTATRRALARTVSPIRPRLTSPRASSSPPPSTGPFRRPSRTSRCARVRTRRVAAFPAQNNASGTAPATRSPRHAFTAAPPRP